MSADCSLCGGAHWGSFGVCPFNCETCRVNIEPCARADCARNARWARERECADRAMKAKRDAEIAQLETEIAAREKRLAKLRPSENNLVEKR